MTTDRFAFSDEDRKYWESFAEEYGICQAIWECEECHNESLDSAFAGDIKEDTVFINPDIQTNGRILCDECRWLKEQDET